MNEHIERMVGELWHNFLQMTSNDVWVPRAFIEVEVKNALTSAYNMGLDRAREVGREAAYPFENIKDILAAIEKEKIESSPE